MALTFTEKNFQTEVLDSTIPVVVDFWASWCRPCHALAPTIDKLNENLEGKAKVGKVNIDANGSLAANYKVSAIPTVIIFKNGEEVTRFVGLRSEESLREAVEKVL